MSTIGPVGAEKYGAPYSRHPSLTFSLWVTVLLLPGLTQSQLIISLISRFVKRIKQREEEVLEGARLLKARWRAKFLPFRISSAARMASGSLCTPFIIYSPSDQGQMGSRKVILESIVDFIKD